MDSKSLIECRSISYFEKYFKDLKEEDELFYDYRHNIITLRRDNQLSTYTIEKDIIQEVNQY